MQLGYLHPCQTVLCKGFFFLYEIIINMITVNKEGFVSARELHKVLEVVGRFQRWFDGFSKYDFELGTDYTLYTSVHPQNKQEFNNYLLTLDMAKEVVMISNVPKGKEVRKYLIDLSNKKDKGVLLSSEEILNLIDMIVASQFFEFREKARKNHIGTYIMSKITKYSYPNANIKRNKVCGINRNELEKRLNNHNIKYVSVDKCLIKIDKFELVRLSVIDCMIHFGKSKEYAVNTGNLAKEIAKGRKDLAFSRLNEMYSVPESFSKTMELLK